MVQGAVFIGTIIAGITQWLKLVTPESVSGHWTIVIAVAVGIGVALLDTHIGIVDISIAQGILTALGAVGVVSVAEKIG